MTTKPFRVQGKHIFLTYSQCPIKKEDILIILNDKCNFEKYIIAQEKHQDDGDHIHALLSFKSRQNIRRQTYFDISWNSENYHPNIQSARSPQAVAKYIRKDKNYIHNYEEKPIKANWSDAIKLATLGEVTRAQNIIKTSYPRDYTLNKTRIDVNLELMREAVEVKPSLEFHENQRITTWFKSEQQRTALWMIGRSGTGKTSYAKSLFENPLLVSHIDQLKTLTNKHDAIIFDDMNFSHWPRESCIHLVDLENDRGINVKHGCKILPKGLPRIFTSNVWIWPALDNIQIKPIIDRVTCVKIRQDLRKIGKDKSSTMRKVEKDDWANL